MSGGVGIGGVAADHDAFGKDALGVAFGMEDQGELPFPTGWHAAWPAADGGAAATGLDAGDLQGLGASIGEAEGGPAVLAVAAGREVEGGFLELDF